MSPTLLVALLVLCSCYAHAQHSPYATLGVRRNATLVEIQSAFETRLAELKGALALLQNKHVLQEYERRVFDSLANVANKGDAGLACGLVCFHDARGVCGCASKLREAQSNWNTMGTGAPQLIFWSRNIFSQNGEDGIIRKLFELIGTGTSDPKAIEFGAWDGFYLSNTAALWSDVNNQAVQWSGVLIEANEEKFHQLQNNLRQKGLTERVVALQGMVGPNVGNEKTDSLENILRSAGTLLDENSFALLSIDIDSHDLQVFASLRKLRPRVVICEYNPTVPPSAILHQKDDLADPGAFAGEYGMGASLGSIWATAQRQGYTVVAVTAANVIMVRSDLADPILSLGFDISFHTLSIVTKHTLMYFITDFNGSPMIVTANNYGPPYGVRNQSLDYNLLESNPNLTFPGMTRDIFGIPERMWRGT
jgi:hypothetical protein